MKPEIDLVIGEHFDAQVQIFLLVKVIIFILQSLDDLCDVIITEEVLILPSSFEIMMERLFDQRLEDVSLDSRPIQGRKINDFSSSDKGMSAFPFFVSCLLNRLIIYRIF